MNSLQSWMRSIFWEAWESDPQRTLSHLYSTSINYIMSIDICEEFWIFLRYNWSFDISPRNFLGLQNFPNWWYVWLLKFCNGKFLKIDSDHPLLNLVIQFHSSNSSPKPNHHSMFINSSKNVLSKIHNEKLSSYKIIMFNLQKQGSSNPFLGQNFIFFEFIKIMRLFHSLCNWIICYRSKLKTHQKMMKKKNHDFYIYKWTVSRNGYVMKRQKILPTNFKLLIPIVEMFH